MKTSLFSLRAWLDSLSLLPCQHLAIACHWSQRAAVLGDVIQVYSGSHGRTIVFCETKKEANELSMNASIKQVGTLRCSYLMISK